VAEFIVLRLTPANPTDSGSFTNDLTGLTINVYDVSFAHSKSGTLGDLTPPIGTATYKSPTFVGLPAPPPVVSYPLGTTIAQHFNETFLGLDVISVDLQSVATAVIPYVAPAAEYPSVNPRPDLRIQFVRAGSKTILDPDVYYDVPLLSAGAAPAPDGYQFLPDTSVSAYVTLPAALNPALASVTLPADGTIPSYDDLLTAINTVLAADPGGGQTLATLTAGQPLTPDQCQNIAYEIVWGDEPTVPTPPEAIESMYTNPPNDGGLTNSNEQDRQQFEGQLNSFYATRNAQVGRLTKYVYAVAAAIWCENQTAAATKAVIQFPLNPSATALATVKDGQVVLTGALGIDVPAQYFYALGAMLPTQVTPAQRLKMAIGANQQQNLTALATAYDAGVVAIPPSAPQPPVNPAQAARLLSALSVPATSSAAEWPVANAAAVWADFMAYPATIPPVDNWRSYQPGDDDSEFWPKEAAKVAPAVQSGLLSLDLAFLTQGYVIANSAPAVSLAVFIAQNLVVHSPAGAVLFAPVTTVSELAQALASDWQSLFLNAALPPPLTNLDRINLLPPFTQPGTLNARIAAFVQNVRKFFDVPNASSAITNAPIGGPPTLALPTVIDPIESFVVAYKLRIGGPFVFGTPLVDAKVDQAVADVFPLDTGARRWLKDTIEALNDLCALTVTPGNVNPLAPSLPFALAEALYARGFTSVADALALSQAEFQDALRGTVAYTQAPVIYAKALTLGTPPVSTTGPGGPFQPINPGSLTNCIPPCFLSPLGAIEYLHELLQLSERSTCSNPFAAPAAGHETVGDALVGRRGPIGSLEVTRANDGTPLPLIDIVNECLESMSASVPPATHGVVYDTADDTLAGHKLCENECCCHNGEGEHRHNSLACHDPAVLFAALPEHSTPAIPTAANANVEPAAFNYLKSDFSSCCLPYSQALDVARTYLRYFCTSRFEVMRTFRRCITEFVLDPDQEPAGFQDHLWRYPVRIDIAIEYLCITPEEYVQVFGGSWPVSCSRQAQPPRNPNPQRPPVAQLFGHDSLSAQESIPLPRFLELTCLSYCEFLDLWKSQFVPFGNGADREGRRFPDCEPCCLGDLTIVFPDQPGIGQSLFELVVFVRLWRKLRGGCGKGYSFDELADICTVLELFSGGTVNPDFIRQLAAFQMLCDTFSLKLVDHRDPPAPGATGANRLHLLALWVGPGAAKWDWAIRQFLERIELHARFRYHCPPQPELIRLLRDNLDPLSLLAGFDPTNPSDTWHAVPTHTLRLAEILAKIAASNYSVGEIVYVFTADAHLDGEDPFALEEGNEALDSPLSLPDDEPEFSLWKLRHKLMEARIADEESSTWAWPRIAHELQRLGFAHADVLLFGEHFFPDVLMASGGPVPPANRRYSVALAAANTNPLMWNVPPERPLRYDVASQTLWTHLPLVDEEVIEELAHLRRLNAIEQQAVQDIYYAPRRMLAMFAMLFDDFTEAQRHLIEHHEPERWSWFQRQFAQFHRRCHIIAEHLSRHVDAATAQKHPGGTHAALLILRHLNADENAGTASWENDNGHAPGVTWASPGGGAFAALLGLTGTGLLTEYTPHGGVLAWREVSGALSEFGHERNVHNCPVPTVVPSLHATLPPEDEQFVTALNGLVIRNEGGACLGGAEGFHVTWTGALLVDEAGTYEFCAGGPTPEEEKPHVEHCEHQEWHVMLRRGQRTWLLLKHDWHEEFDGEAVSKLALKRGVYELTIRFVQRRPHIRRPEDARHLRTGFQLKYSGPDTGDRLIALPHHRLFCVSKDATLDHGIAGVAGVPADFLQVHYTSSLRDIRRTYQRAFKALLFAHRFDLSAQLWADRHSELGYMLEQKSLFAGRGFYRAGAGFTTHAADFDFNLLPLLDDYHAPAVAADARVQPTVQRRQALFDWWERIFDYTHVRKDVGRESDRRLWLLFDEANEEHPANPGYLLRHIGADARRWPLELSYFQDQTAPVYAVGFQDLEDDRWAVRTWHADEWIRRLLRHFCAKDIGFARPDLWASDDPSAVVPGLGPDGNPNPTGNANLSQFLVDGCIENGSPRRYEDLKRLNDCLRERGRDALLAYLCAQNRVPLPWGGFAQSPKDLSNLLLLDVESGICERASRIDEAISAVQNFVHRARLGLETWTVSYAFAQLWDGRFANFKAWEACRCRELYRENWIDWNSQESAQKTESFRFLQSELRRSTLTAALPGGLEYWPDQRPMAHPCLNLLQDRDPSSLTQLSPAREGLGLLGTPERDARPSWLAPLDGPTQNGAGGTPGSGQLPFWIESAIRLGVRFYRIAAGGVPPAVAHFEPRKFDAKPNCCCECGRIHPEGVDEYYFWLLDSRFFKAVDAADSPSFFNSEQDDYYDPTTQDSTPWHDDTQLPNLLEWNSSQAVRLAWCRVHNGEFKQPRKSTGAVQIPTGAATDLTFLGREADSLVFQVNGGIAPTGFSGTDAPGFRYDLARDSAVVLPLLADPPAVPSPYPAGLPAYPYFVYVAPGAPLFSESLFSPSLAIACALRARCRFEPALKWYALVYDPLQSDNTWMVCDQSAQKPGIANVNEEVNETSACCDTTDINDVIAQDRSILLHYLETLIEWGDALMRRHSPEAFQQARRVFDTASMILGPKPCSVKAQRPATVQTVSTFTPMFPPLNPRLLDLYCHTEDRLALIRNCLNARRLRDGPDRRDLPFWGEDACCGCHTLTQSCDPDCRSPCTCGDWCRLHSPYRFTFLVQKAQELAAHARDYGAALLAAFERGDAEYLASMRARHELELLNLTRVVRQDQWRESDWQRQGLQKTKETAQTNRRYYAGLIQNGLNSGELQYEDLTGVSLGGHVAANIIEGVAEAMDLVPDLFVGFPCEETWLPLGTKLSGMFKTIARVTNSVADMAAQTAGLDLTQAGWARRLEEWVHQVDVLDIDIQQIERQILASERRRDIALHELNNHQRQIENSREVMDFLRDKFTSHELYLYLQKETAALHCKMWELARQTAEQAERAFRFERGDTARHFLPCEPWDSLHEGLLAGERLQVALGAMEKAYFDLNVREYELSKHLSLRLQFPLQFLQLKTTGVCEIEIPEWRFDLDYPGQYLRRIRNVTLTIPCVTGPYTGVHCRLTLLSSQARVDPALSCPPAACCDRCTCENDYEACRCDPRFVRHWGAREAIATSSGQNDGGMFELNFRDERYLPFEFLGAVSRWRIELPRENNFFDMDTLSDVILNLNYTAREGGELLRRAANEVAQCRVQRGWSLFDVRHEFPNAWHLFQSPRPDHECERHLKLTLTRRMFPYLPCERDLIVTRLALLIETPEARDRVCCTGQYACCHEPEHGAKACGCQGRHLRHCEAYSCGDCEAACCCECIQACHRVEVTVHNHPHSRRDCGCDALDMRCVASADYPALYHGVIETRLGLVGDESGPWVSFEFPRTAPEIYKIYLMCYFEALPQCSSADDGHRHELRDPFSRGAALHQGAVRIADQSALSYRR
jgi:Tc toxin complex TcA C-terminal TcB-binding domain